MTAARASGRVVAAFARGHAEGRLAFVGYLPLGDPLLGGREEAIARDLVEAGVDMLELGLPWHRPLLDGAIIAGAQRRALDAGYTVEGYFADAGRIRRRLDVPLVLMTYVDRVLTTGAEVLAGWAEAAGLDAALFPDCPAAAWRPIAERFAERGVDMVRFLSARGDPRTLSPDAHTRYGYIQAADGLTGAANPDFRELGRRLQGVKRINSSLPLMCGIGIRSPAQVAKVAALGADGVVVATALVEQMGDPKSLRAAVARLRAAGVRRPEARQAP